MLDFLHLLANTPWGSLLPAYLVQEVSEPDRSVCQEEREKEASAPDILQGGECERCACDYVNPPSACPGRTTVLFAL
jgi:hypothetical protein